MTEDEIRDKINTLQGEKNRLTTRIDDLKEELTRKISKSAGLPSEPGLYRGDGGGVYDLDEEGFWGDGWGNPIIDLDDVIDAMPLVRLREDK